MPATARARPKAEVLTPEDAAKFLKVHKATVLRALQQGRLPGAKVGSAWRILRRDLEDSLHGSLDTEPLENGDLAAIRRGLKEIRRGATVSLEDYERERGL